MNQLNSHLIFTVIAPNYAAQAMILGRSLAQKMPNSVFRIVVLQDCLDTEFIKKGIDKYLTLEDVKVDHAAVNFQNFDWSGFDITNAVNQYDLLEFATSVKPTILKSYLNEGYSRVTYLDPDIQIFSDFMECLNSEKDISLTPHILEDFPMDSKLPDQQSILYAGIYNLGFISVTSGAMPFLKWWENKLNIFCSMDVNSGYHVDQRWVDWATSFVDVDVIREPGLNVAYWNLHERSLSEGPNYQVNSNDSFFKPLRFFHFSGFIGPTSEKISRHCTRKFKENGNLNSLLAQYYEARAFWKRTLGSSVWSLGGRLAGSSLPNSWRKDILTQNRKTKGKIFEKEFNYENEGKHFCNSLNCQSKFAMASINSLLNHLSRNTVSSVNFSNQQSVFEELRKLGYPQFKRDPRLENISPSANLCLVGYFAAPTGVGQIARNTLRLLEDASIPVNIHILQTSFDDEELLEMYQIKSQMSRNETTVIGFVNADMWIEHLVNPGIINLHKQTVAAVWAWEIEDIPMYFIDSAKYAHKIYAISQFSAQALGSHLKVEIEVFPTYGNIVTKSGEMNLSYGKNKKYILARFDAKSVIERKNPVAVLETWNLVKSELFEYELVIKTIDFAKTASLELLNKIQSSERVILIDEVFSEEENKKLLENASAYISLHRAEGLGLNILESLALDIPTVVTNYSGLAREIENLVFPVDYEMIQIGKNAAPYPSDGIWADPSITSAAEQLVEAIRSLESGSWATDRKMRLANLREFLRKAETSALANCAQLLSIAKNPALTNSKLHKRHNIRSPKYFLRVYGILPTPLRKITRQIFIRYFKW